MKLHLRDDFIDKLNLIIIFVTVNVIVVGTKIYYKYKKKPLLLIIQTVHFK